MKTPLPPRLLKTFAPVLCLLLAKASFGLDINYSGSVTAQVGLGLPQTSDNAGKILKGDIAIENILKAYHKNLTVSAQAIVIGDAAASQSSNGISTFATDNGFLALKLKEAYVDYNGGFWALRAGRQIAGWGKADGLQVADILCPQDESNALASTYKESRQGIDAIRLSYINDFMQADAYWIPIFTPSVLPFADANPLHKIVFPKEYGGFALTTPKSQGDLDAPSRAIYNSEAAARLSFYFSKFDLSFYGFYGWEDLPLQTYTATSEDTAIVTGKYERLLMFAVDTAVPMGDFVLRAEAAYFPERRIQTSADWQAARQSIGLPFSASKKRCQLRALAGLDWTPAGGWTITAQYMADIIIAGGSANLDRKRYEHLASLSVEKAFLNDLLTISALAFFDLNDFSSSVEIEAEYSVTDSFKAALIGNLYFEGREKGMYGIYKDLSCATLRGKVSF